MCDRNSNGNISQIGELVGMENKTKSNESNQDIIEITSSDESVIFVDSFEKESESKSKKVNEMDTSYFGDKSTSDDDPSWSVPSFDYTEQLKLLYAGVGSMELKENVKPIQGNSQCIDAAEKKEEEKKPGASFSTE